MRLSEAAHMAPLLFLLVVVVPLLSSSSPWNAGERVVKTLPSASSPISGIVQGSSSTFTQENGGLEEEAYNGGEKSLVFAFGDSLWDTGNCVLLRYDFCLAVTESPYGCTFPGHPANRFSDGRLVIDYLATYLGLPPIPPFHMNSSADFSISGVNYAVAGASALNLSLLHSVSIFPASFDGSIQDQISWHLALKEEVQNAPNSTVSWMPSLSAFTNGLYIISIGGNDYSMAFEANTSTLSFVSDNVIPLVILEIRRSIEKLYLNGARNFLLVGTQALGCMPFSLLTHLQATKDDVGCVEDINIVSQNHSQQLLHEIDTLQEEFQGATFVFADFHEAHLYIARNSQEFGFISLVDACCGTGYYYHAMVSCGDVSATVCSNPNTSIFWDRRHNTDNFNLHLFDQVFRTGCYLNPTDGLLRYINVEGNTL